MSASASAPRMLAAAAQALQDRAASRDAPDGERSMARAVAAFNAAFARDLTEEEGWQFMAILKLVRGSQGAYREDDYVDEAAYAALAGEAAERARGAPGRPERERVKMAHAMEVRHRTSDVGEPRPAEYADVPAFLRRDD